MFASRIDLDDCNLCLDESELKELHRFEIPNPTDSNIGQEISIRTASHRDERNDANSLINRRYSWRGYGANHRVPIAKNCTTFTAWSNNLLIGTISLTVDSPDGLACDDTFKDDLEKFRNANGAKICELTKFAFDTPKPSLHLLGSMFHIIFIYGTYKSDCSDLFIEVNPRHRRFYEAMLGFETVGTPKTNNAVGAPSHLMALKVSDIRGHIDQNVGNRHAGCRSLYPYFFSMEDEIDIYARLVGRSLGDFRKVGGNYPRDPAGFKSVEFAKSREPALAAVGA
jgi:hypothetical protein